MSEIDEFFTELERIFQKEDFTKAEVVESIKRFIPSFEHEEKGKNLDQKMYCKENNSNLWLITER